MKIQKYVLSLAVATTMAVIGAPCLAAVEKCEVKLGVVGPFSGGAAQWGLAMRASAKLAVLEVNHADGLQVDGQECQVKPVAIDSAYSAQGAAGAANALASHGIRFVMGPGEPTRSQWTEAGGSAP